MSFLLFYPRMRPLDDNGEPMPGCYLQFYESGTTTPAAVYADGALTTPLSNPVVANAAGIFPAIYGDPSVVYRMQLYNAADVLISDDDPIHPHVAFPAGTVVMFNGTAIERDAAYPSALWELCDGDNGTPDTRDRSPVGVSGTKAISTTGGASSGTTSSAGAHDHGAETGSTVLSAGNMPVHSHEIFAFNTTNVDGRVDGFALTGNDVSVAGERNSGGAYILDNGMNTQIIRDAGTASPTGHTHSIASVAAHTHDYSAQSPYFTIWFLQRRA